MHVLNVTSQTWLTQADFETEIGHVWKHWVVVIIPDVIEQLDSAVMCESPSYGRSRFAPKHNSL